MAAHTDSSLLANACRMAGVPFAAWLHRTDRGWRVERSVNMARSLRGVLTRACGEEAVSAALDRTLASDRARTPPEGLRAHLGEARLFPAARSDRALLLIGFPKGGISADAEAFLRRLARQGSLLMGAMSREADSLQRKPAIDLAAVVDAFLRQIPCLGCDLAVRWGDRFRVAAATGFPAGWIGRDVPLADSPLEARLVKRLKPVVARLPEDAQAVPAPPGMRVHAWLGIPLAVGERVIGRVGLAAAEPGRFTRREVEGALRLARELAPVVEGILLFQEATRRLGRLAVVHEVTSLGAALADREEILQRALAVLRRAFNTGWVTFLPAVSDATEPLTFPSRDQDQDLLPEARLRQAVDSLRETTAPLRGARRHRAEDHLWLHQGAEDQMTVPVRFGGVALGRLVVEGPKAGGFGEEDERLLAVLAGQLGGLLENARLYREMGIAVRQLSAIRDTALDLASRLDHPQVLDRLLERTQMLMRVPAASLGLVDPEVGGVRVVVCRNPWGDDTGLVIPFGQGLEGAVAARGEAIATEAALWWQSRGSRRRSGVAAGVPLRWGADTVGVLSVLDDSPQRTFTPDDLRMLELLAPQAALTVRNARLVQDLRQQMEERKQAEAQLIQTAKLAAVGQMAAGLAHEVNNPLTTVAGFAELWLDEMSPQDPRRPELELMTREAQRARAVVARLLDFARQGERVQERCDLNEVVGETLDLMRHLLKLNGVDLRTDLAPDLPWLDLDRRGIKQVVLNLIHNAMQAMPSGGRLWVETGLLADEGRRGVAIRVRDTGIGISEENLDRIFEPFFTTKPGGEGTGLGLAVSHGIVAEAGGRILVRSTVGVGTQFEVWLPVPEGDGP